MKKMDPKCCLVGIFICSLLLIAPVAAADDEWYIPMEYCCAEYDTLELGFGTNASATDGWDRYVDMLCLPLPPFVTSTAFFEIEGDTIDTSMLNEDYRNFINESNPENVWTLCFVSKMNMSISWDASNLTGLKNYSCVMEYDSVEIDMLTSSGFDVPAGAYIASITVTYSPPPPPPVADFTNTTARIGRTPLSVSFEDTSTGGTPTEWTWNFGDGSPEVSGTATPGHTYTAPGDYNVTLTAGNTGGSDTISKHDFVITGDGPTAGFDTQDSTVALVNGTISFRNLSTGPGPLKYLWDFGDGTSSDEENPFHVYETAGSFDVSLTVTNEFGTDTHTERDYITTGFAPVAAFHNATARIGYAPLDVGFSDDSTGTGPLTYCWSFGDGNTSSVQNPYHTYESAGEYNVSLTVTNLFGEDTLSRSGYVVVHTEPLVANFTTISPRFGPAALVVWFKDTSTGSAVSNWTWSFGDGAISHEMNPSHIYTVAGNYDISLTVKNVYGITDTMCIPEFVVVEMNAGFTVNPTSGETPLTVQFNDTTLGGASCWNWSFGDGTWFNTTVPAERNATHTYTRAGNFTVTLTASNSESADSEQKPGLILVLPDLHADFSADPVSGPADLSVRFTDLSLGEPSCWNWSFGDGTWFNTTLPFERNATHTYTRAGNYTVTLTVSNGESADAEQKPGLILVSSDLHADFSADPVSGPADLSVRFTDLSLGGPSCWNWSFGDGSWFNTTDSAERNATHTYTRAGAYTVSLHTANANFSDVEEKAGYISVVMVTNFTTEPTGGLAPLEVHFSDQSLGEPSCWNWSFGDGSWFNTTLPFERNPIHTYTSAGNYTVRLLTSNEEVWDTEEKSEYVLILMNAFFTTSGRSGYAPLEVTFTDQSTGIPVNWTWEFGDGTTSDEQHPVHRYTEPGTYSVTLSVESAYGAGATATREGWVMVYPADTGGGGSSGGDNSADDTAGPASDETTSTVTATATVTVVPPDSNRADASPADTPSGVTETPAVPPSGDAGGIPLPYIAGGIIVLVLIAGLALAFLKK